MRCIFCKTNSDASNSVEHIIPESLGNVEHFLPAGWVCDTCNNYFSREVEKPFLSSPYGRSSRFSMRVQTKKGRIPSTFGIHAQSLTKVESFYSPQDGHSIAAAEGEDEARFITSIRSQASGTLYFPLISLPEADYTTSRFIGKIALEVFAFRGIEIPNWNHEIVEKKELNELRQYVRMGIPKFTWPIHIRRIYAQDFLFNDPEYGWHEMLNEFTLLVTPDNEYYVVVAIFGVEYTINLGGSTLEGFLDWLKKNNYRSPLYVSKNT